MLNTPVYTIVSINSNNNDYAEKSVHGSLFEAQKEKEKLNNNISLAHFEFHIIMSMWII